MWKTPFIENIINNYLANDGRKLASIVPAKAE